MGNIYTYLKWRGDLNFVERPFCEVDNLILSELCYMDFSDIVPSMKDGRTVTLEEAAQKYLEYGREPVINIGTLHKDAIVLPMADTARYRAVTLSNYIDITDRETGTEFAAMHIGLGDGTTYIAFRGTCDDLVGWREDFGMSFEIMPTQKSAVSYLNTTIDDAKMRYRVGGHSKGGHLAVYGAMLCEEEKQDQIVEIYSNDGPGMCNELVDMKRYEKIADMLLQKTYTENCINKKVKKNRGEMAKYLITNNHPAIISKETFKLVQAEIARRSSKRKTSDLSITEQGKYSGKFALTELLVCGECGSPYRRKTWVIKGEKKRVWRCLNRVEHGTAYCKKSVSLDEDKLQEAICRGLRNAFEYREEVSELILSGLSYAVTGDDNILDAYVIEQKIKELKQDMEDMIMMSMRTEGDTEKFEVEIRKISDQLCVMRGQLDVARNQMSASEKVNKEIENIRAFLEDTEINFSEYNEIVVRKLVECIRVMPEGKILIVLKGGMTIEEQVA